MESEVLGMKSLLGDLVSAIRAGNAGQGATPSTPSTSSAATGLLGASPAGSLSQRPPLPSSGSSNGPQDGAYYPSPNGPPNSQTRNQFSPYQTQGSVESPNSVSENGTVTSATLPARGHRGSRSQNLTTPSPRFPAVGGDTPMTTPGSGPGVGYQVLVGPNGQQQAVPPIEQLPPSHHSYHNAATSNHPSSAPRLEHLQNPHPSDHPQYQAYEDHLRNQEALRQHHHQQQQQQRARLERNDSTSTDRDQYSYSPPEQVASSFGGPTNAANGQHSMHVRQLSPPGSHNPQHEHQQRSNQGHIMGPPQHPMYHQHHQHLHQVDPRSAGTLSQGQQQIPYPSMENMHQHTQTHAVPRSHQANGHPYDGPPYVGGPGSATSHSHNHEPNGIHSAHEEHGPQQPPMSSSRPQDPFRHAQRSHLLPQHSPTTASAHNSSFAERGPIHHDDTVDYGLYAHSNIRSTSGTGRHHTGYSQSPSQSPSHSRALVQSHSRPTSSHALNATSFDVLANSGGTRSGHHGSQSSGRRRGNGVPSSAVTSANSSDAEDELPSSGLVAPFSVLRGMADRAERMEAMAERGERVR